MALSVTLGNLVMLLASRMGEGGHGTASSGSSTTIVDTNALSGLARYDATDDPDIVGHMAYIWEGINVGAQRRVSALNITTLTATLAVAYASAITSASKYVIVQRWSGEQYEEGLRGSARDLTWEPTLGRGIMKEVVGEEVVIGNAFLNGSTHLFSNTFDADGFSFGGNDSRTQETTLAFDGATAQKIVTTGGDGSGYMRQSLSGVGRFAGKSRILYARVRTDTAAKVTLELTDGVTTKSVAVTANNKWEWLQTPALTVDAAATSLRGSVEIAAQAGTVTTYVSFFYMDDVGEFGNEASLDADRSLLVVDGTLKVSEVPSANNAASRAWPITVYSENWEVTEHATRRMRLNIGQSLQMRVVRYTGWKAHTLLSTASIAYAGPTDAILELAQTILENQKSSPQQQPSIRVAASPVGGDSVSAKRREVLMKYGTRLPMGWKQVEPVPA